jgi:type I restriction enzyme R subunit
LDALLRLGISPEIISSVLLKRSDIDGFDALSYVAFDAPIISRDERARALVELKQNFINSFPPGAREIILDLIEQYRVGGIDELKPEVFRIPRFTQKYGGLQAIIQRMKTKELQPIFNQIKQRIYE